MADGKVVIDIIGDVSDYEDALSRISTATERRLDTVARGLQSAGKGMTIGLTAPILAIGALSVKAAMDFESSFAGVRKTVEATEEEFERLAEASKAMSMEKVASANDINRIMELAGQLGIATDNLEQYAGVIADLDVSTNLGAEEAATQIAQYTNITGMAQTQTENLGSTIVALGNSFATTEADIMAMSMRVASAGTQIGLTDAEIMALSTSLASVGINAEAGGTAISTVMSQIDKDVALNTATVKVWADVAGMSAEGFAAAWKERPVEALQAVFEGMGSVRSEGGNLNLVLDQLGVTSLRQTDVMKRLGNASELFGAAVQTAGTAWSENSALAEEAGKRYATTESSMAMLKNTLAVTAAEMGGPLLGAVNDAITAAKPLLEGVRALARGFSDMGPAAQGVVIGLVATVAAIGPVTTAFGKVLEAGNSFKAGMRTIQEAMAAQAQAERAAAASTADTAAAQELAASKAAVRAAQEEMLAAKRAKAAAQEKIASLARQQADSAEAVAEARKDAAKQKAIITAQREAIAKERATQATIRGAAATGAEATASGVLAVAKGAQTVATGAAATAQRALNAAMAANPVMFVVSALMILLPLVGSLISGLAKASSGQDQLTAASKRQKQAVDAASKSYDEAVAAHGATSDAALAAKAALDQESAAFERTRQTLGEFSAETDALRASHAELMASLAEGEDKAQSEAGALLLLRDRIAALAASDGDAIHTQAALTAEIAALAQLSPEAAAGLDAQKLATAGLAAEEEAMITAMSGAVEAEKRRIMATSSRERYNALIEDEIALEMQLKEAMENAAAASGEMVAVQAILGDMNAEFASSDAAYSSAARASGEYDAQVESLNEALEENRAEQAASREAMVRASAEQAKLTEVAKKAAATGMDAAAAYKAYEGQLTELGLTAEDVAAEIAASEAEQAAAVVKAKSEMAQAIDEYVTKNSSFAAAMQSAGLDSTALAERLSSVGLSLSDITSNAMSASDAVKSGMEQMTMSTAINAQQMAATMQGNTEFLSNYADNLSFLMANAGTDAQRELIGAIQDMPPGEGAALAQQMADDLRAGVEGQGLFNSVAEAMKAEMDASAKVALSGFTDGFTSGITEKATEIGQSVAEPVGTAAGEGLNAQGQQAAAQLAEGLAAGTEGVQTASQGLADAITNTLSVLDLSATATATVTSYTNALAAGVGTTRSTALLIGNAFLTTLKAVQAQPVGAKYATDLAAGVASGTPAVQAAGTALGNAAVSGAQAATGGAFAVGLTISQGIASGAWAGSGGVNAALAAVVRAGIEAGRRAAEAASPSKRSARRVGKPIGEGVWTAILAEIPATNRAMDKMMDSAIGQADDGMGRLAATLDLGRHDLSGLSPEPVIGRVPSTGAATGQNVTYVYQVGQVDMTDDRVAVQAVDALIGRLQRRGAMG
jgi:TP901 family phage tail tape measure protein